MAMLCRSCRCCWHETDSGMYVRYHPDGAPYPQRERKP